MSDLTPRWNFVASSKERIARACDDWEQQRFDKNARRDRVHSLAKTLGLLQRKWNFAACGESKPSCKQGVEVIMKIPDELQIPAVVFSLQAAMLFGLAMVFLVLLPN
ncbi:pirin-like C-terminal cupin domain-containing protein [Massilia genomosp. 1]|uniref:pirin-like C-terminal cupin domain-containing protein n=1 Tax=Massilia genomosp. 1 TaxID=2609280 RepID=UPI0035A2965F